MLYLSARSCVNGIMAIQQLHANTTHSICATQVAIVTKQSCCIVGSFCRQSAGQNNSKHPQQVACQRTGVQAVTIYSLDLYGMAKPYLSPGFAH